jgi:L-aminopeptidase/D-esterase-like protein
VSSICDVAGLRIGHHTDPVAITGCTVVLCEGGAVAGVDVRGGAPGTRETDLLRPENLVQQIHAVLLAGGSAFGLDAAGGVMEYLESRGVGFPVRRAIVPIVVGAVLSDLSVGDPSVRPNAASGRFACEHATSDPPAEGSVGAGTGATLGKVHGPSLACKGGLGTASLRLPDGATVGALVAVNAVGDVVDPMTGAIVAGARRPDGSGFAGLEAYLGLIPARTATRGNTTIGVVATDAPLDKAGATRLAQMAQDGLALAIRPAHTAYDGDTLFALSTHARGEPSDPAALGVAAVRVVAEAVVRAARAARGLGGVPAASELEFGP